MDSFKNELCCNLLKEKTGSINPLKGQRERERKKQMGLFPWLRLKWSCLSRPHYWSKKRHLRSLLLLPIVPTPTSRQMSLESHRTCKVMPNYTGNISYPDRALLPNRCVWSKPTRFTGASWAQASVKTKLRPFISMRSNSCRDIIAPVSPDPSLELKLIAAARFTKMPS